MPDTTDTQLEGARQAANGTFGDDFGKRLNEQVRESQSRSRAKEAAEGTFGGDFGERLSENVARQQAARAAEGTFGDDFAKRLEENVRRQNARKSKRSSRRSKKPAEPKKSEPLPDAVPVGAGDVVVRDGDCITSIAAAHGHDWETIWNDAGNAELREARKNPQVLLPGDRVVVPPIRPRITLGQTELRHRFRKKSDPSRLHVVVKDNDRPRANAPFTLDIDGDVIEGLTDANGQIIQPIPASARKGKLRVGDDERTHELLIGHLDPIQANRGVQQRLSNLGFQCGSADGRIGPRTERAVRAFQQKSGLPETGRPDADTRAALVAQHAS